MPLGFGLRNGGGRFRLLFATDLHGSELVFRKFLNAVRVYEADVAILGGDLTGKAVVPVVEEGEGFVAEVHGAREVARSDEDVARLLARIRDLGHYPLRLTRKEREVLARDPAALEARSLEACRGQVADWMERGAERLEPLGVPLFVTGGNDDDFAIEEVLEGSPYVVNAEGRVIELAPGVEMISTGYGNPTPWRCPRDLSEDELSAKIEAMATRLRDPDRSVFNLHVPPLSSGLDLCPKLDTSTYPPKPLVGEETAAGSRAVREAIEHFRPTLSLHGHIHGSPGIQKLGPTTCVNPGSEYGEGVLRTAVVDLEEGRVRAAQLLAA